MCKLSGERGPALCVALLPFTGELAGMTSGCVRWWPRCSDGGGETLDTLFRFGLVVRVRAGPPLVLGGSADGSGGCACERDLDRDRDEKSSRVRE